MNRQIRAFRVILVCFQTSGNFIKKLDSLVLSNYGPSTSCTIWDKSNEPILRKYAVIMDEQINWTILCIFGPFPHKQEFFQINRLRQFWVIMAPQLHAQYKKKLMNQSLEKCCDKKWMYEWTDRPKFIGPSQSVGPILVIKLEKKFKGYRYKI